MDIYGYMDIYMWIYYILLVLNKTFFWYNTHKAFNWSTDSYRANNWPNSN